MKKRTNILVNTFGIILSILLFVGIFYLVPITDVWDSVKEIDLFYVLILALATILNLVLKAKRWTLLCPVDATTLKASVPINVGLALNNVLPGKLGEIIRIALGAKMFKLKYSTSTATVLGDRLLDTLALLLIAGFSFFFLQFGNIPIQTENVFSESVTTNAILGVLYSFAIISFLLVITITGLLFEKSRYLIISLIKRLPLIGEKLLEKIEGTITGLTEGLESFRTPSKIAMMMNYSLLLWFILALGTWALSFGVEGFDITFPEAIVISTISILAASLPSSPGAWGIFEAGTLLSIQLLGIECEIKTAAAFAFSLHFGQYLTVILAGIVSMFTSGLKSSDLKMMNNQIPANE